MQVSLLEEELGYPCYIPEIEKTVISIGHNIRSYFNLIGTARALLLYPTTIREGRLGEADPCHPVLALLGIVALVTRYRRRGNRLVQVVRRDGGLHYLTLLGKFHVSSAVYPFKTCTKVVRVVTAVLQTPSAFPVRYSRYALALS